MNETNIEADWRFVDAKNFAQFEIRDAKVLITLIGELHEMPDHKCSSGGQKYIKIIDYVGFVLNDSQSKIAIESMSVEKMRTIGSSVIRSIYPLISEQTDRVIPYDIRREYLGERIDQKNGQDGISLQDKLYTTEWSKNTKKNWIKKKYVDIINDKMLAEIVPIQDYSKSDQLILDQYKSNIYHLKEIFTKRYQTMSIQDIQDYLKDIWMLVTDYKILGIILSSVTDLIIVAGANHVKNLTEFLRKQNKKFNYLLSSQYNQESYKCISIKDTKIRLKDPIYA